MMGNALIGRLFYSLCKHKVPILFDAPIVDLTGDRRGVKGARLNIGGKEVSVKTRKGVVLATGGYAHNKRFREAFMPQPVPEYSMSYNGNHGDGVDIGQRLGAAIAPERCTSGLWTPVSIVPRPDSTKGLFPHLVLDRAKPGLIAVNSAGRRFVNEAASYHDFVLAMFESHKTAPSIPAWLICDADALEKYGLGVVYPGHRNPEKFVDSGYLVSARTLEELASNIGADSGQLRATVLRYNGFADTGVDVDFGKGEPSSTASTAIRNISPTLVSGGSRPHRSMHLRSGRPTLRSAPGLRPTPTHACSTTMESRSRGSMPVAMIWLLSWRGTIPVQAPRSARRSCLRTVRRCTPRARCF